MALTDVKLRTLKKPGKHFDGEGLYLEITPAGGRYWRWKYRYAGREKRLALGVYPAVTLKDARTKCNQARQQLRDGTDPGEGPTAVPPQFAEMLHLPPPNPASTSTDPCPH